MIWRIHIQLGIAAVGQSPSGLWYTCVHAKQLQIDPMYMWVEKNKNKKYSLFLRQCKVYQPARSQSNKGAKKKKKLSWFDILCKIRFMDLKLRSILFGGQKHLLNL